jgi:hypothetical protein
MSNLNLETAFTHPWCVQNGLVRTIYEKLKSLTPILLEASTMVSHKYFEELNPLTVRSGAVSQSLR